MRRRETASNDVIKALPGNINVARGAYAEMRPEEAMAEKASGGMAKVRWRHLKRWQ